jgi:hypothetical protein
LHFLPYSNGVRFNHQVAPNLSSPSRIARRKTQKRAKTP